jgi:hypothetical protein
MTQYGEMSRKGIFAPVAVTPLQTEIALHMGRRGGNLFKRNDGLRALKIARDGGIEPAMIEIVAKDGTIFRIYGDNATVTESTQDAAGAKAWNDEITKLKGKPGGR